MGGRSPRVAARACALVILVVVLSGSALLGSAPRARADHETVPWSTATPLVLAPTEENAPNIVYNGSHGLYAVVASYTSTGSANLTFFAESEAAPYASSPVLYTSQPNDQVGGVGTVSSGQSTGSAVDAQGRVYVAWSRASAFTGGAATDVNVSTSLDHGHTWARMVRASAANDLGQDVNPLVQVGPDGRVWIAYEQVWGSSGNLTVAVSSDHGATFQGHWNATGIPAGFFPEAFDFAIDMHGRLHLAYSACTLANVCPLAYTWSDDGATWSRPRVLVNASATGPSKYTFDPSLAIEGSTVNLDWLDSRATPTGYVTMYYDRSTDLGATWALPVPISQGLSQPFFTGARLAAFGDTVMSVWGASGGFAWAVSATGGATWSLEQNQPQSIGLGGPVITADANGTFHVVALGDTTPTNLDLYQLFWDGPPDAPTALAVASPAAQSLRLSWTAPPQGDVVMYDVWTSPDGSTYSLATTVNAPATSWLDTGLANGTFWFKVTAVDATNHVSHDSVPVAGIVGPSLQDQIDALRQQLASANADLSAIQAQLNALQSELNAVQGNTTTLQGELNVLQGQLDQLRTAQTVTTLLLIIVVVVLAVQTFLLLRMGRRPKKPVAGPPGTKFPEDEL